MKLYPAIDLMSGRFYFAGIAIGKQGVGLVENVYADRLLRHPDGSYLILRVPVARVEAGRQSQRLQKIFTLSHPAEFKKVSSIHQYR